MTPMGSLLGVSPWMSQEQYDRIVMERQQAMFGQFNGLFGQGWMGGPQSGFSQQVARGMMGTSLLEQRAHFLRMHGLLTSMMERRYMARARWEAEANEERACNGWRERMAWARSKA